MNKKLWAALICAQSLAVSADPAGDAPAEGNADTGYTRNRANGPAGPATNLDPVTVTATSDAKRAHDLPYSLRKIDEEQIIDEYSFRTMPEALKYNPGVLVQQTGPQQESPYLRSFTGYRTGLYIDGIRVNNGIWREGPNQYFGTIDNFTIDTMETIMGPGSVLYGSDAIGGTVNVLTRSTTGFEPGLHAYGRTVQRFNTADMSWAGRFESTGNLDNVGWVIGISPKNYEDTVDGHGNKQPHTGYEEFDGDAKIDWKLSDKHALTFAFQHYGSYDAWRVHNTIYSTQFKDTKPGDLLRRSFDLYRELGYVQYHGKNLDLPFADTIEASFSVQSFNEPQQRSSDGIVNSYLNRYITLSDTTIGTFVKASKKSDFGTWSYGVETYQDTVSAGERNYRPDGTVKVSVQGPVADDSNYGYTSAYIQNQIEIVPKTLDAIIGGRYTYVTADVGTTKDDSSPKGKMPSYNKDWSFATGSGKLLWHIDAEDHWNLYGGISQGARAPTLADLSGSELSRSNELQTPQPNIKEEEYVTYETGLKTQYRDLTASLTYYYNDIQNMITRVPTGRIIDGDYEVKARNVGHGHNQGIEMAVSYRFLENWTTFGFFNWQDGQVAGYPLSDPAARGTSVPSRLTPINGWAGLRYDADDGIWWVQADMQMAAAQHRLSFSDTFDKTRIPPSGSSGYIVPNLRAGYSVSKDLKLGAQVSNFSDTYYRVHGSGMNAPGVSGTLFVDWKF